MHAHCAWSVWIKIFFSLSGLLSGPDCNECSTVMMGLLMQAKVGNAALLYWVSNLILRGFVSSRENCGDSHTQCILLILTWAFRWDWIYSLLGGPAKQSIEKLSKAFLCHVTHTVCHHVWTKHVKKITQVIYQNSSLLPALDTDITSTPIPRIGITLSLVGGNPATGIPLHQLCTNLIAIGDRWKLTVCPSCFTSSINNMAAIGGLKKLFTLSCRGNFIAVTKATVLHRGGISPTPSKQ